MVDVEMPAEHIQIAETEDKVTGVFSVTAPLPARGLRQVLRLMPTTTVVLAIDCAADCSVCLAKM